ncbi:hypothetical protein ADK60_01260 [Streptomyces sp. XY431]|uniref:cupredoxin domain-containing protein n=1 Tax=Streptomyces sp. XY431 TaxID=1415562 RepID=UPI0006AFC8BE|nr:cupredoxin domain-containing protein [Streptomyces sp. XY431]KOV39009.1 hypothetical protein ADK60_01260 [Streptomyces sp. XY431]
MGVADVVVVVAAVALIAGLGRFFFGPRRIRAARLEGRVQRVDVTVRGGYRPDVIRLRQGVPAELVFDRQESGECTSRVVFPDLRVSAALPAFKRTTVTFVPAQAGSFGFACGMNMIHGTLLVEPDGDGSPPLLAPAAEPATDRTAETGPVPAAAESAAEEDAEAAERQEEIKDLTRRVVVGAVLTAPAPRRSPHCGSWTSMSSC